MTQDRAKTVTLQDIINSNLSRLGRMKAMRHPVEISTEPGSMNFVWPNAETDLVLCRKIRFGNNGNFTRYVPIDQPSPDELRRFLGKIARDHREKPSK